MKKPNKPDIKDSVKKDDAKDKNPMRHLTPGASEMGPVLSGTREQMAAAFKEYSEKNKPKQGPRQKGPHDEFVRLAVEHAKQQMSKQDGFKHPEEIASIASRHKGIIPEKHPDRQTMAAYINKLHVGKDAAGKSEARRLYDVHISGGGAYVKSLTKSDTSIYVETYSDGTIDVIFGEDVNDILEKSIVAYLSSKGYQEILEKGLKAKHKAKKGGMTAAGVKAYRRENPGSKLQTAVTEDKPKGKRAKRRRSFCARMSGVKGPMKDKNGKPTRKALALRRWKC